MLEHLLSLILFSLASLSISAQAQKKAQDPPRQEPADVIRIDTNLVETDVMVFDKQGNFVEGLQPDQFELEIDGKRQSILFFEGVVAGSESEEAQLKAGRSARPSQAAEKPATTSSVARGRTVLFFLDDLHITPGSTTRIRKTLLNFIEKNLREEDRMAITSSSGRIGFLQQLTNNKAVLRAAVERINYVPSSRRDSENPSMSEYAALMIAERNDRMLFDYFVQQTMKANNTTEEIAAQIVQRRARYLVTQSDALNKLSLITLGNLMRSISGLSGRKLMFFISEGFVPNYTGSDVIDALHRATDGAASAGVVIYALDARGLATDPSLDASSGGGFDPSGIYPSRMSSELSYSQEPLYTLAADTGGRALVNSNSLDDGIARALKETSSYYLLAWRPEIDEKRGTKSPKIKISITGRPELKVRLRRGYLGSPSRQTQAKAELSSPTVATDEIHISHSSPVGEGLQTSLSLGYKHLAPGNMQLVAVVQVTDKAVAENQQDSPPDDEAEVLGAVFDTQGKAVGSFKHRVFVQKEKAKPPRDDDSYNYQVNLAPGLYQVRTFGREKKGRRLATAMEWIEIPNFKAGQLAMSSIFLGEVPDAQSTSQVTASASRVFARSSGLRFTTYIYNASQSQSPPDLGVQTNILSGDRPISVTPERKVPTEKLKSFSSIPYSAGFSLGQLPAGRYKLLVKVTDVATKATVSHQTDFVVY